jgi:hypothetical protein
LGFSQIAVSRELAGELAWYPLPERSVRTTLIVFLSPGFDEPFGFVEIGEPVSIQALGSEGPIERYHERIVGRLTRTGEVDLQSVLISPHIHRLTGELRYGYRKIRALFPREGWDVVKYLVYRLYKEEGLALKKMQPQESGAESLQCGYPLRGAARLVQFS